MNILFLTNNKNTQPLIDWLQDAAKEKVIVWHERLSKQLIEEIKPDLVVSYNYKFIIKKDILNFLTNRALNLHISLLPYNRGSNPNLWSFIEDTPKGVSIHYIHEGLDTGDILLQEEVVFDEEHVSLSASYQKLHDRIQRLFKENWHRIKESRITAKKQTGTGTSHSIKDFEKIKHILGNDGWDISIPELKKRYRDLIGMANANSNLR